MTTLSPTFVSQPATDTDSDERPEPALDEIVRRAVDGLDMVRKGRRRTRAPCRADRPRVSFTTSLG